VSRHFAVLGLMFLGAMGLACAHVPALVPSAHGLAWASAPADDDSTLALFRFEETTGLRLRDDGPHELAGDFGEDTQPDFGRFHNARTFKRSINSFAYIAPAPILDFGPRWSVEAWVKPSAYGGYELSVLAARWTESANEQSWVLGITGRNIPLIPGQPAAPDVFTTIVGSRPTGRLVFVLQPSGASPARAFMSARGIDVDRWTHVAVTYDGSVLRMYLDGRLDAQFAIKESVRPSGAPLVIGNLIDPRWLTRDRGPLQVDPALTEPPFFAYEGEIDELRLSISTRTAGTRGS